MEAVPAAGGPPRRPLRIVLVHPDLGIGGAERLVVDAAAGLQARGHSVTLYTSHHDPGHAFPETVASQSGQPPLLRVQVRGDFLPIALGRAFGGGGYLLCAIARNLYLAACLLLEGAVGATPPPDVVIVDQLSACIPLLRFSSAKILFYCHFPDKLLSPRRGLLKRLYRIPLDWMEELTTKMADAILVNSKFTAGVFARAFPLIRKRPQVVYPGIHVEAYDTAIPSTHRDVAPLLVEGEEEEEEEEGKVIHSILSINRFERKKDLELALHAFARLREQPYFAQLRLVLAGGYDPRVGENVEYQCELQGLAHSLGLTTRVVHGAAARHQGDTKGRQGDTPKRAQVVFLLSFTLPQRNWLLRHARCLVYTPSHEHFGIVPVEAMYCGLPVIAVANGGPTESVLDGVTGWLCPAEPLAFSAALHRLLGGMLRQPEEAEGVKPLDPAAMRRHVVAHFSRDAFVAGLERELARLGADEHPPVEGLWTWRLLVLVGPLLVGLWLLLAACPRGLAA